MKFVEGGFKSKEKTRQKENWIQFLPSLPSPSPASIGSVARVRKFRDVCAAEKIRISARVS
jgi:hypothetical protein